MPWPLRLPSSLSRLWFFGVAPKVTFRARAVKSPPPSSPPPRASPPRDCPILRPRAVGCLSRGHATLLRDELRNHTPHAIPLILATRCWLLHVCIETLGSPFSLQPRVVPYPHAAEYTRCLSLSSSLFCSQDDRDAHQLCSGEDHRPRRRRQHSHPSHVGGFFARWHEDCVRIGRRDDQCLGFRCRELKIAPPWPKLTPAGLSGRQTGAAEREDERPQRGHQLGRVFPGRDQDCVGIGRQDDQSLGVGCAGALKLPLLGQN